MREICIKTVYKEEKSHIVRLGNGTVHKFPSEKAARKFLADTNRFLSGILFSANKVLVALYAQYREVWVICDEIRGAHDLQDKHYRLESILQAAFLKASWSAGNYFTFINLRKFTEQAKDLIKFYKNLKHVQLTDTLRRHNLDELFNQVHGLQMQLNNYGQLEAYELFNVAQLDHIESISNPKTHLRIA